MKNPLQLIDRRGLLIVIGAATLVTLISVIVIVLTVGSRNRDALQAEEQRLRTEQQALASSTNFGMEDFYLDARNPDTGVVYPARRPKKFWNEDEVDFYWIDPAEAGIDSLSEDNDALIYEMLGADRDGSAP